MLAEAWDGLSVLYVSPIRALLNNQEERLERYFGLVGRRAAVLARRHAARATSGGSSAEPPDCLLTTPESLEVMLVSARIDHRRVLPERPGRRHRRAACLRRRRPGLAPAVGAVPHPAARGPGPPAGRPVGDGRQPGGAARTGCPSGSARGRQVIRPPPADRKPPEVQLDYVGSLRQCRQGDRARCTGARSGSSSATAGRGSSSWPLLLRERGGRDVRLAQLARGRTSAGRPSRRSPSGRTA